MRAFEVATGLKSDPRRLCAPVKAHKVPDLRLSVDAKLFFHLMREYCCLLICSDSSLPAGAPLLHPHSLLLLTFWGF